PITARWTTRTESGHCIITPLVSLKTIGRADGEGGRFVAGRMNSAVDFLARRISSLISGSRKYQNSRIHEAANRTTQGVILVRIDGPRPNTHVDDADVVLASVCYHPVESGQNTLDRSHTSTVQNTNVKQ